VLKAIDRNLTLWKTSR